MPKCSQEGTQSNRNEAKREAKTSQGIFKDALEEQGRTGIETQRQKTQTQVSIFKSESTQNTVKKLIQIPVTGKHEKQLQIDAKLIEKG